MTGPGMPITSMAKRDCAKNRYQRPGHRQFQQRRGRGARHHRQCRHFGPGGRPIACRSTLTNPTNGCVPLDVFGTGVASPAAVAYVNGVPDFSQVNLNQDVASASMQGKLPWELPAGPVAVAFGAEYRKEAGRHHHRPRALSPVSSRRQLRALRGRV